MSRLRHDLLALPDELKAKREEEGLQRAHTWALLPALEVDSDHVEEIDGELDDIQHNAARRLFSELGIHEGRIELAGFIVQQHAQPAQALRPTLRERRARGLDGVPEHTKT